MEGEPVGELGVDVHTGLRLKWVTNQGALKVQAALLKVTWQTGREGSLGENGYMYMYG